MILHCSMWCERLQKEEYINKDVLNRYETDIYYLRYFNKSIVGV